MKRFFLFAISAFLTLCLNAKKVTQFMGIPIDGTKYDMIPKLQQKGFVYNSYNDYFTGEFNGQDVEVYIVTNHDIVWRIFVYYDKYGTQSVSEIKSRFNILCRQFENNPKYMTEDNNQHIADDEDISYEIRVNDKQYQASFYQISSDELDAIKQDCMQDRNINDTTITKKQSSEIISDCIFEVKSNYLVWFTILKNNGKYTIGIYYDNGYNKPNGEDL